MKKYYIIFALVLLVGAVYWYSVKAVSYSFSVLVIGGGGGGATPADNSVAGGGAGGMSSSTSLTVLQGTYIVTVGTGGAPRVNGGNSSFATLSAVGGGTGQATGGSGGGGNFSNAGGSGTANQGNGGGSGTANTGGGGGGAGAVGGNGVAGTNTGGAGGNGVVSSITGSSITYACGGGGGGETTGGAAGCTGSAAGGGAAANGGNGRANDGDGGGGAYTGVSGNGSTGVVIISYVTASVTATCEGTQTTSGSNTICTYNQSGYFIVGTPQPWVQIQNASLRIKNATLKIIGN